ncbi:MAG: amino acid transporter [Acidobacteria bacterium]|nr:MAG: amino acid transporter [Acidobacteriota bacterium]
MQNAELPRKLGLLDAAVIVVGTVIGSAIFLVPNSVARNLSSAGLILLVWIFTGLLSFFGALAYAELGAMMPDNGGQYVYLREAYGPLAGFLSGWALFLVMQSGGIATLAAGFSIYLASFVPLSPLQAKLSSVMLVAVLSLVNYPGVRLGAGVQRLFTFLKLAGLTVIVVSAFASPHQVQVANTFTASGFSWSHFGVAMIACLWAYEGWNCISFVAGEVKHPERNLPLALGLGLTALIAIYLTANVAYMRVMTVPAIAATERVAASSATLTLGPAGATLVSLTILLSIIGASNGNILTSSRIYFAQARDGLFFRAVGNVHPHFRTPHISIMVQGIWAAVLAVSGSYERLFSYVVFTAWIFYGMTVLAVMVLRRSVPDLPRPYRMWGYPVTPLAFAAVAFWFVINTIITTPASSLIGLAIVASGVPVYYIWRRKTSIV